MNMIQEMPQRKVNVQPPQEKPTVMAEPVFMNTCDSDKTPILATDLLQKHPV